MDTLGIEPRASRMLSGCDTTTPRALYAGRITSLLRDGSDATTQQGEVSSVARRATERRGRHGCRPWQPDPCVAGHLRA